MLRPGNENPYLKGKSPKKHIPFVLKEEDPLRGLHEDQRKAVIKALGKSAQQEFTKHLQRLQMLVREYNPFQILAHLRIMISCSLMERANPTAILLRSRVRWSGSRRWFFRCRSLI